VAEHHRVGLDGAEVTVVLTHGWALSGHIREDFADSMIRAERNPEDDRWHNFGADGTRESIDRALADNAIQEKDAIAAEADIPINGVK
jgi:hypothetical protein